MRPVIRRLMGHGDVFGMRQQVTLTESVTVDPQNTRIVAVKLDAERATPIGTGNPRPDPRRRPCGDPA